MRKQIFGKLFQSLFVALVVLSIAASGAAAEVSLSVNIGPPLIVAPPSAMVMVPGSSVYFAPGLDIDIFFYGGYWWSPRGDRWYRARAYDGPWRGVSRSSVPRAVHRVPGDYRSVYAGERHIPYGQWKKGRGEHRGKGGDKWEHKGRFHGGYEHVRSGHGRGHD